MERNVQKMLEEVKINDKQDLSVPELKELIRICNETKDHDAISLAYLGFKFGYAVGAKQA